MGSGSPWPSPAGRSTKAERGYIFRPLTSYVRGQGADLARSCPPHCRERTPNDEEGAAAPSPPRRDGGSCFECIGGYGCTRRVWTRGGGALAARNYLCP